MTRVCPLHIRFRDPRPLEQLVADRARTLLTLASARDRSETTISYNDNGLWFVRAGHGAALARQDSDVVDAYPVPSTKPADLWTTIVHEWQPLFRQYFGTQVLHASAALHTPSSHLLVLAGPTHSGKSSLAFGMQRRPHWHQIADDFIGFRPLENGIQVIPLPNLLRLRPPSAEFFDRPTVENELVDNILGPVDPCKVHLLLLSPCSTPEVKLSLRPIGLGQATTRILESAFAVSTEHAWINRTMMHAYLQLTRSVPVLELAFSYGFDNFDRVLDLIERRVLDDIPARERPSIRPVEGASGHLGHGFSSPPI